MFQGASSLHLDAKGRLNVPSRYRDALQVSCESRLTITKHPDGCLMLFPRPEWEIFRDRIASLPIEAQWWKRIFLGNALETQPDSAGRLLITPELKAAANLSREVILLGMGKNLELWDKAKYETDEARAMSQPMPEVFKDFSF